MSVSWTALCYLGFIAIGNVMAECPSIVTRAEWGAKPPRLVENMTLPVPYVVIHHTFIPAACTETPKCMAAMRTMQFMHQTTRGWNDIGYNFCIGGDGQVYEGRGWNRVGAHAPKYNQMSIGICFIGDYQVVLPPTDMLAAAKSLIKCGIDAGVVAVDYKLLGHRQVRDTLCPGSSLYGEIKTWPHWSPLRDIQPRLAEVVATATPVVEDNTTESDVPSVSNSLVE